MLVLCQLGLLIASVAVEPNIAAVAAIEESRFGTEVPPGWQLKGPWTSSPNGALARKDCQAVSNLQLPDSCLVQMIFDLPAVEKPEQSSTASITVGAAGDEAQSLTVSAKYHRVAGEPPSYPYQVTLVAPDAEESPNRAVTGGDMRPAILHTESGGEVRRDTHQDDAHQRGGWFGKTVSLGFTIDKGFCRMLVNGNTAGEIPASLPAERVLSVTGDGITLRSVRVLRGIPGKYAVLSGRGLAMLCGGTSEVEMANVKVGSGESAVVEIDSIPFMVQGARDGGLVAMDVAAERYHSGSWSEGTGMPKAPLPANSYSVAWLLLHASPREGTTPAMGFGLRVPEMSGGDLRNIYVGDVPVRSCDVGVAVRPLPDLGNDWYLAHVPINPAALIRPGLWAYFTRPWTAGGGTPRPYGEPSSLRVAACTVEVAGIELAVQGNGLGNVYDQLARPSLQGVVCNRTENPVMVNVTTELIPFGRDAMTRTLELLLDAGQKEAFDALAAPITERGHYRVRVVADGGHAGTIEHRTNVAMLAPDTRTRVNSPFGCWDRLWTDGSTDQQSKYLKVKAGIGFWAGAHQQDIRVETEVPDDAKAEEIARSIRPGVRVFMLGWEQNWGLEHTFAFPRIIAEGQVEEVSDELRSQMDETAERWRRMSRAIRKYRPDVKISLGNSAVNFSVPLLARGFKPGVEFDYFGTEEGIFSSSPEQPATAIGNINWWAKAICEHFGFEDVPLFHSESVYFSTGPGFSRMSEATQAANYVRTYLLGYPYDSVFGLAGAIVDSSNRYIYSNWGASGYCNQAPECSPKLSYVAFATLTQLLDNAKYEGKLETGTTSVYALKFSRPGGPVCVLWNLRGQRNVSLRPQDPSKLKVFDAIHRPVSFARKDDQVAIVVSELPVYVTGSEIDEVQPGANVAQRLPERSLLSNLENLADWQVDSEPDEDFEQPGEWTGVPNVMGQFDIKFDERVAPEAKGAGAVSFTLQPLEGKHGLLPRYISLSAPPGKEIPIPKGTTRLGIWIRGNSTWAAVKLGVVNHRGERRLLLNNKTFSFGRFMDNFDGWRFLDTGLLDSSDIQAGRCKVDRIIIVMPGCLDAAQPSLERRERQENARKFTRR